MAAFDYQVFSWVYKVLSSKGVSAQAILMLKNLYCDSITIPLVNNVFGKSLENIRGSLRQGDPGSMAWFSFAIDPLLLYLSKRLTGIPICQLPSSGPENRDGTPPEPVEEKYVVFGYADDVKPSVTTIEEFKLVDHAASLFGKS